MLKGGQGPQGVGHLLGGVLGQGLQRPVACCIQDLPSWVVPQLGIRPQAVGHRLQPGAKECGMTFY